MVSNCQVVFEQKGTIALQAGHASPVKWCFKEKVLLGKWSAIAMLLLQTFWVQSYTFARLALTEGQHRPKAGEHRPKAGKKKKTREAGLFFLVPLSSGDASSRSGLTDFSPHSNIYLSIYLSPFIP